MMKVLQVGLVLHYPSLSGPIRQILFEGVTILDPSLLETHFI